MAFLTFFLIFSGEKRKPINKNFSFEFTKTESLASKKTLSEFYDDYIEKLVTTDILLPLQFLENLKQQKN